MSKLSADAHEFYDKILRLDRELTIKYVPGTDIYRMGTGISGKGGSLIHSISGSGETPEAAVMDFKSKFDQYQAWHFRDTYYIFYCDKWIPIHESFAKELAIYDTGPDK